MASNAWRKQLGYFFKNNIKPGYRQIRRMDTDDWLATVGLERRNVAADWFGAIGLLLAGCGIGVCAGLLLAPRRGIETRAQVAEKLRGVREAASEKASEIRDQAGQFARSQVHA